MWREEGRDDLDVNRMTLKELREQVMYDPVTVCNQIVCFLWAAFFFCVALMYVKA